MGLPGFRNGTPNGREVAVDSNVGFIHRICRNSGHGWMDSIAIVAVLLRID